MISTKKLIRMVRKWQRMAVIGRKKKKILAKGYQSKFGSSTEAEEGHFVVYSIDGRRFVFPIAYLNTYIFRELLLMSEEEFGLPRTGPITFPCDASFMEYAAKLIQRCATKEVEKALVISLANRCAHPYSNHLQEAGQYALGRA